MKKETQEAIREAIVDWLSTHYLMQGEFEILKRYVRRFYDISLYDITEEALVSLWKNSGANMALRRGAYCVEDFWDFEGFEMMLELDDEEDEDESTPPQTYPNFHKGETGTYTPQGNVSLVNSQERSDIKQHKTPFTYTISGIPEKLVLTYELKESERIPMEKNK